MTEDAKTYTPAALAALLNVPEENVLRWRRQHSWPSFKVGRKIRFTQEHVDKILAQHEAQPAPVAPVTDIVIEGQTERSKRRSA